MRKSLKISVAAVALLALSACGATGGVKTKDDAQRFSVNHGTPVVSQDTLYRDSFACLAGGLIGNDVYSIAVGKVKDYTGKFSYDGDAGGYKITQGGSLMVSSAVGKLASFGAVLPVERLDTGIADTELLQSNKKLVSDSGQLRLPKSGMITGSDYYIVGGITEANYNIASGGAGLSVAGVGAKARYYAMNVAADLRLVDTKTREVVAYSSLQKEIVGHEVGADVFSFFGGTSLVDFGAGEKSQEPIQTGVRAILELGTLELMGKMHGVSTSDCAKPINSSLK